MFRDSSNRKLNEPSIATQEIGWMALALTVFSLIALRPHLLPSEAEEFANIRSPAQSIEDGVMARSAHDDLVLYFELVPSAVLTLNGPELPTAFRNTGGIDTKIKVRIGAGSKSNSFDRAEFVVDVSVPREQASGKLSSDLREEASKKDSVGPTLILTNSAP